MRGADQDAASDTEALRTRRLTAITDARGRYEVRTDLADSACVVVGVRHDLLKSTSDPFTLAADQNAVAAPDLRMRRGSDLQVTVVDVRGRGVAGATTLATVPSAPGEDGAARVRVSDSEGRVAFTRLPPGSLTLTVRAEGLAPLRRNINVPVPPASAAPILVTLEEGVAVSGVVSDATGRPVSGASVTLMEPEPDASTAEQSGAWVVPEARVTDSRGRFRFRHIGASRGVRVRVVAVGFVSRTLLVASRLHDIPLVLERAPKSGDR